jgi:hypothetical protein
LLSVFCARAPLQQGCLSARAPALTPPPSSRGEDEARRRLPGRPHLFVLGWFVRKQGIEVGQLPGTSVHVTGRNVLMMAWPRLMYKATNRLEEDEIQAT